MIWKSLGAAALLSACAQPVGAQSQPLRVAIVGATVLPMTDKDRLTDQTVLVEGARIVAVGPRRSVKVPAGYRTIDARGRFLMPGLVDMHMHLSPEPGRPGDSTQRALSMTLANGIMTARVMLGQPAHPGVRAAIERGELAGPRIYIAAPALNDNNTPTAVRARQAVSEAKAASFDLLKMHGLDNVAVWQAVHDEAKKQGIAAAGHVTNVVGLKRAMAVGQQVEHLDSVPAELLPAGASRDFGQILPPETLDALDKVGVEDYAALARNVAAQRSFHVPTLGAFERITEMRRPFDDMLSEPDADYVAPWIVDQWRARRKSLYDNGFGASEDERMNAVRNRLVKAFNEAGVQIMAGSDTPHPFHVWGFGLIREIEALSAAGLGPMAALRAATVVPRDYFRSLPNQGSALGWKADFGTVEAGARGDLLLLDADPSRDLSALKHIRALVAAGRIYGPAELQAMLRDAAASGKAQPNPAN